jgi:hypothetical protein
VTDTVNRALRRGAAAGVAAASLVLAGCSSSSHGSAAGAGATPTPTSGPAAIALARSAMHAVHSYAFRLIVQQTGKHASVLSASGVVQAPSKLSGEFTVGGSTVRVLAGPKGEFVQLPGKKWQREPKASVHPLQWDKVLAGVGDSQIARGTGDAAWRITAHPSARLAPALALSATPTFTIKDLQVTIDLDGSYRVVRLDAVATGSDAGAKATIHETVSATGYDSQPPVPDHPATGSSA